MADWGRSGRRGEVSSPRTAKFYFFEAIDNLMEVEDELSAVGDEETVGAIEAWEVELLRAER
jgi:hypothetical protein